MPIVRLSDGRQVKLPDGMSKEDMKTAIDKYTAQNPRVEDVPKVRIPYLKAGAKVTESGPEFEFIEDINDPRLTENQRDAVKGMIGASEYDMDAAPGSYNNPIFKSVTTDEKGKRRVPLAPVDTTVVDETGKISVQKPKKSQLLGFTTGVRRATNNLRELSERSTKERKKRESEAFISVPGPVDLAMEAFSMLPDNRKRDEEMVMRARQAGVEPGIIGDVVGSTIGTLPYVAATRNPMLAGAAAGGLNTKADTPLGVAADVGLGAVGGKAADVVMEGLGKVVAPQVSDAIQALANKGVELTPGQVMGGTVRNMEETLAGFPIIGGLVSDARSRSTETFNRAMVNDVLSPLGRPVPAPATPRVTPGVPPPSAGAPGLPSPTAGPTPGVPPMLANPNPMIGQPKPPVMLTPPGSGVPMAGGVPPGAGGIPAGGTRGAVTRPDATDVGPQITPDLGPRGPKPDTQEIIDTTADAVEKAARVAPDIKSKLPDSVETGGEALTFAHRQISLAYDDVIPKMTVRMDPQFMQDITEVVSMADEVTPELAAMFRKTVNDRLVKQLERPGSSLTGQKLKDLTSYLQTEAREFGRSTDPMQRKLGNMYAETVDALKEMAKRQNPSEAKRLADVDEAYSMLLRVEKAAAKAPSSIFGPSDLRSAVMQLDRTGNKRATAQGRGVMQQQADDAVKVLGARGAYGSQVPSRALLMGGAGAAVAGQTGVINPLLGALVASPLLAYSQTGTKLLRNAMLNRPKGAPKVREAINQSRPVMSVAAGAAAAED